MSDHVRKLDFTFDKPPVKKTPSLSELGASRVPQDPSTPYVKNTTESDPFNFDIKSEQHGDNITTSFEHSDNPFQHNIPLQNNDPYYSAPKFSRGRGIKFLLVIIMFIAAASVVTFVL